MLGFGRNAGESAAPRSGGTCAALQRDLQCLRTRLPSGYLFAAAQQIGLLQSRSAAQQVNHWARIGRALETANGVSQRRVNEVLAGSRDYDELSDEEQALIRAEWAERIESTRRGLNLAAEFAANRVEVGGHDVPEDKVRSRYQRLWGYVSEAITVADEVVLYDNTSAATALQPIAAYLRGRVVGEPSWPSWVPAELLDPPPTTG